jgi:hypothetical protein
MPFDIVSSSAEFDLLNQCSTFTRSWADLKSFTFNYGSSDPIKDPIFLLRFPTRIKSLQWSSYAYWYSMRWFVGDLVYSCAPTLTCLNISGFKWAGSNLTKLLHRYRSSLRSLHIGSAQATEEPWYNLLMGIPEMVPNLEELSLHSLRYHSGNRSLAFFGSEVFFSGLLDSNKSDVQELTVSYKKANSGVDEGIVRVSYQGPRMREAIETIAQAIEYR